MLRYKIVYKGRKDAEEYLLPDDGLFTAANGNQVRIHMVSNPSHLEAVNPVAMGRDRLIRIAAAGSRRPC